MKKLPRKWPSAPSANALSHIGACDRTKSSKIFWKFSNLSGMNKHSAHRCRPISQYLTRLQPRKSYWNKGSKSQMKIQKMIPMQFRKIQKFRLKFRNLKKMWKLRKLSCSLMKNRKKLMKVKNEKLRNLRLQNLKKSSNFRHYKNQ